MKLLVVIGFVLFYGILGLYRGVWLYLKTGVNPLQMDDSSLFQRLNKKMFLTIIFFDLFVIITFWMGEETYAFASPILFLEKLLWIKYVGGVMLGASFFWTLVAQYQMSTSWRIGFDKNESTELVKNGLFRISRNPVFLGFFISAIGFFMVLPNALSFCIVFISYYSLSVQIRLEEEYLNLHHLKDYKDYCDQVPRWI